MKPETLLEPTVCLGDKVPLVYQYEAVECGAASLAMVLGYFGCWVSLEELRAACGVSRDGSKASNVLRAARSYGLEAKGYKRELGELKGLSLPLIVFWNFNHFLVVTGIDRTWVYLNDPAGGRRRVSHAEFDESFTGVVMTFTPSPTFQRRGSRPSIFSALGRRMATVRDAAVFLWVVGIGLILPGLVAPMFSGIFIDKILLEGNTHWRNPLLVIMGITALLLWFLNSLQNRFLLRSQAKLAMAGAGGFFWHVLRLPIEFFSQRYAGEVGGRVALNDKVARVVGGDLARVAVKVVASLVFLLLLFFLDWAVALSVLMVTACNAWILKRLSGRLMENSQRVSLAAGKVYGATTSGLGLIESLKATGSEEAFFSRWAGYAVKYMNAEQDAQSATLLLGRMPGFISSVSQMLVLLVGGWRAMNGDLSIGMLVAAQSLSRSVVGPMSEIVTLAQSIQQVDGDLKRLDDVLVYPLDAHVALAPAEDRTRATGFNGRVTFQDISFGYSRIGNPLVDRVSFDVLPGQRVAIVGGSGSGKSTLAKLLLGLYPPWSGQVLFDGRPREDYDRTLFATAVSFVDQDIYLFEGTVRDNLTLWDPDVSEEQLVRAARDACILDEILRRPGGFDSKVEEGGRNFSGGQRQRLEIARALVPDPRLLVLDEATSALDPVTEREFDNNLRRRGCTVVTVAHRLSTIRDADEILVMVAGSLLERGTHEQLLRMPDGFYKRLVGKV